MHVFSVFMPDVSERPWAPLLPDGWRSVDTCAASDALDRHGRAGVVTGLVALSGNRRIVGRAVTVELGPAGNEIPSRHLGTAAVEAAAPGDVIVVANRGRTDCAGWGGNLSLAAHRGELSGVVVDGACRDVAEADALGFAVFARAATPRTARGRICEVSYQEPVVVGDVIVRPGDVVVADSCGVVFISQEWASSVMATALEIMETEADMATAIRSGVPISQVMGSSYERGSRCDPV
jgi:4-hydroxy-4-methyl-2-oxoglutarate aldolase